MDPIPLLQQIAARYVRILGDTLTGIYVHGSIAFGCFVWEHSDIDFLVVVRRPVSVQTKLALLAALERLRPAAPQKGLEMSVVLEEHCRHFVYPTPYELHFSNAWLGRYLENPLLLCGDDEKADPDLAAHFTVIKHTGIALLGRPIPEVFGDVPRAAYLDSIRLDIQNAREHIREDPVYVILNLCRVLAYLEEGLVLSKAQGGAWGLRRLSAKHHPVIESALRAYTQKAAKAPASQAEASFCGDMLARIYQRP